MPQHQDAVQFRSARRRTRKSTPPRCNSCASSPASTRRRRPMPRPSTAPSPKSPTARAVCWRRCKPSRCRRATVRSRPRRRESASRAAGSAERPVHRASVTKLHGAARWRTLMMASAFAIGDMPWISAKPIETQRRCCSRSSGSDGMLWWSGEHRSGQHHHSYRLRNDRRLSLVPLAAGCFSICACSSGNAGTRAGRQRRHDALRNLSRYLRGLSAQCEPDDLIMRALMSFLDQITPRPPLPLPPTSKDLGRGRWQAGRPAGDRIAPTPVASCTAIKGHCQSNCTLFLGLRNVCVERSATLLFHAGHDRQRNINAGSNPADAERLQCETAQVSRRQSLHGDAGVSHHPGQHDHRHVRLPGMSAPVAARRNNQPASHFTGRLSNPRNAQPPIRTGSRSSSRKPFSRANMLGSADVGHHGARGERAGAIMRAGAEGDALLGIAGDVETVRLGKAGLVAIGRAEHEEHAVFRLEIDRRHTTTVWRRGAATSGSARSSAHIPRTRRSILPCRRAPARAVRDASAAPRSCRQMASRGSFCPPEIASLMLARMLSMFWPAASSTLRIEVFGCFFTTGIMSSIAASMPDGGGVAARLDLLVAGVVGDAVDHRLRPRVHVLVAHVGQPGDVLQAFGRQRQRQRLAEIGAPCGASSSRMRSAWA